jgi:DNA repair protein RadC
MSSDLKYQNSWLHPGGKLRELGPKAVSTKELLAILISTGHKGKSAEDIAGEILDKFESLEKLSNAPLAELLEIKGLGDVKIIRIAAALELARRTTEELLNKHRMTLNNTEIR